MAYKQRPYAPLREDFDDHPKLLALKLEAMGLIACAITYSTRRRTNGRIPRVWPGMRFGAQGKKCAAFLVSEGVWRVREDGDFEIVGFLEENPSAEEIEGRISQKADAGRLGGIASGKARREKAHAGVYGEAPASSNPEASASSVVEATASSKQEAPASSRLAFASNENEHTTDPLQLQERDPPLEGPPSGASLPASGTNATADGAFGLLVTAWAEGIRSVTGVDYRPPRGKAAAELSEILKGPCAGAPDACEAARQLGAEYARANPGTVLSPFKFGDWLGSKKPVRSRGPTLQPAPAGGSFWKPGLEGT